MAQHDYVIANGTGAAVRSDLNNGLAAIVSQNSGTTEPTTTYAYMRWADTTAGVMKMRNGANNAWITLYQLDGEWSTIAFENGSASAPSIYFKDSGTDTGIYSPGTDQVAISTNGTQRVTVDSSGNVGIGTGSPSAALHVRGATPVPLIEATGAFSGLSLQNSGGSTKGFVFVSQSGGVGQIRGESIAFTNADASTERVRIDSSGRLLVGTSTTDTSYYDATTFVPQIQLKGSTADASSISLTRTGTSGAGLVFQSGSSGNNVASGGLLGEIIFSGYDGANYRNAARIEAFVDATPGSGDMPGRLVFSTTADSASSPTERLRITQGGNVLIGSTSYDYRLAAVNSATNSRVGYLRADSSSYTDSVLILDTPTAAGTGFRLIEAYAGSAAIQFRVRGDGVIFAQNTTVQSLSDIRVKENIQDSTDGLDVILGLRPVRFDFKEGFGNNRKNQLGFIAQEVESVFPDAVDSAPESDDGAEDYKSVGPGALIPVLVKAIQEQQAMITELQAQVAALKAS